MPVFKPRSRMISFRISEDEYQSVKEQSLAEGARSISDYARLVLCRGAAGQCGSGGSQAMVSEIGARINELDREVRRLAQLVTAVPSNRHS